MCVLARSSDPPCTIAVVAVFVWLAVAYPCTLCRCYQPLQSRAAGDMVVLVGIGVGESDVHSNVVYFKDPRPGAGTLEVQGITLYVVYVRMRCVERHATLYLHIAM